LTASMSDIDIAIFLVASIWVSLVLTGWVAGRVYEWWERPKRSAIVLAALGDAEVSRLAERCQYGVSMTAMLAALDAAEADADRLAEALDLLGEHDFGCPAEPCGCELEAALDDHAKRKEERA